MASPVDPGTEPTGLPIIRNHLNFDRWRPKLPWRQDDVVQWGHPRAWNLDGESGISVAFFEVFPREGGYVRGEGSSVDEAEASCHAKALRHRACAHQWSRKFTSGLGQCRLCGARRSVFEPIVDIGSWKAPLTLIELDSVYCGHLEPVDHAELATERRDRRNRRTWLRFRLNGVDLPAIPEEPKDILERTPFQRQCEAIVLDLVRRGGGQKAFDEGRLEIDGRTIAILVGGLSGLAYEFKRWRDKGCPERALPSVKSPEP